MPRNFLSSVRWVLAGLVCFCAVCRADEEDPPLPPPPGSLGDVLAHIHILEARATAMKERTDVVNVTPAASVTWTVTRIYSGAGVKLGDTFETLMADGAFDSGNRTLNIPQPIPRIGDLALWQLHQQHGTLMGNFIEGAPSDDPLFRCFLGTEGRLRDEDRVLAPKLANVLLSMMVTADEGERLKILLDAAHTTEPGIASAACTLLPLTSAAPDDRDKLERELFLDPKVVIEARLELDGPLCKSQEAKWSKSKEREDAFMSFVTGEHTTSDFVAVGARMCSGLSREEFSTAFCLRIVRAAWANDKFLPEHDELGLQAEPLLECYAAVANHGKNAAECALIFKFFADTLAESKKEPFQDASATALYYVSKRSALTADQLKCIRDLRGRDLSKRAKASLELLLKEANSN